MEWSEEALTRVGKVPVGFMRNMTKKRIEEYAVKNNIEDITLEVVEQVIDKSKAGMGSLMGGDAAPDLLNMNDAMASMGKARVGDENNEDHTYFFCFVCGYVVKDLTPDACSICESPKEKYSEIKPEFITRSSMEKLHWTSNALVKLEKVPPDFKKEMTKWEIEGFARKNGYLVVSADVVDERYDIWKGISCKMKSKLIWMADVKDRLGNIPDTIKGMVVREMELIAEKKGKDVVDMDILEEIKEKWTDSKEFHVKWM